VLIAVEIREDSTVALVSAQGETIARLQSLLQRLSRKDAPDNSRPSPPGDESSLPEAGAPVEITEENG